MKQINSHIELFKKHRISTIVRTKTEEDGYKAVRASIAGGIKFIEITLTIPNAFNLIKKCAEEFPEAIIGAGTVLTIEEAKKALENKAKYLVSPITNLELLEWSNNNDILLIAGAVTPTEMYNLVFNGAAIIKFYPASAFPLDYVKIITNPFPNFKILATGGVNLENIDYLMENGCFGVGITEGLGNPDASVSEITLSNLAKTYIKKIKKYL